MPVRFASLAGCSLAELTTVFNQAFAHYFVPLQLSPAQMQAKLIADQTDLSLSVGAFVGERLIGFILHGIDWLNGVKTAYNGGTGIVPEYRGQRLTQKLYETAWPRLRAAGVVRSVLEVVAQNTTAICIYKAVGFTPTHRLECFRGTVIPRQAHSGCTIGLAKETIPSELTAWNNSHTTWQHNTGALLRQQANIATLRATKNGVTEGVLLYHTHNGKLLQMAVSPKARRQGIATDLLLAAAQTRPMLTALNIEEKNTGVQVLLQHIGLSPFLTQYEMEAPVP
jgi:ribosomal protein S18 acetylase RimI-like enzyme